MLLCSSAMSFQVTEDPQTLKTRSSAVARSRASFQVIARRRCEGAGRAGPGRWAVRRGGSWPEPLRDAGEAGSAAGHSSSSSSKSSSRSMAVVSLRDGEHWVTYPLLQCTACCRRPAATRLSLLVFNRSPLMTLWPAVRLDAELEWQCLALASRTVEDAGKSPPFSSGSHGIYIV